MSFLPLNFRYSAFILRSEKRIQHCIYPNWPLPFEKNQMVFLVYLFVERFFPNTFHLYKKLIILPFPLEIYFKGWSSRTLAALAELSSQHPRQLLSTFYNSSFSESDTQFYPLWAASHVRAHTYLPHTCIHTHKYCFKLLLIHMWLFFIKYHTFPQSVTVIFKKQRVVRKEREVREPW